MEDRTNKLSELEEETKKETPVIVTASLNQNQQEIEIRSEKYTIVDVLSKSTGEAEIYLIQKGKEPYVFKYYYPNFKPKIDILKKIQNLEHQEIIKLYDYGYYEGRFYEILEYAKGGSLIHYIPIRDKKKILEIVKEVVNAFEFFHNAGIIHRDIKLSNLFYRKKGKDLVVGDFGISSLLYEDLSKIVTNQSRTELYAAPELYQNIGGKTILGKEVDYYALGICILHLWMGEEPFKGLSPLAIMRIKLEGQIILPEDMPEEIKQLIRGLLIVEPENRWGYEEVQKWLRGEKVPVKSNLIEKRYKDFYFGVIGGKEIVVHSPEELAEMMEKYPEQGKKHLYKGTIAKWLEDSHQGLYVAIRDIVEEEYPKDQITGLKKAIYILNSMGGYKTKGGIIAYTSEELGDAIEKESKFYKTYLKDENADLYIYLEARGSKDIADIFRNYYKAYIEEIAFNKIVLDLQGKKFKYEKHIFYKPKDLLLVNDSLKDVLAKELSNPDSKLSIWLQEFDLNQLIQRWRNLKRFSGKTLSYALESGSPFHIDRILIYDYEDLGKKLTDILIDENKNQIFYPENEDFFNELLYWLKNYHNVEVNHIFNILENTIKRLNTKTYSLKNQENLELFIFRWLEHFYARGDEERIKKTLDLLEVLFPDSSKKERIQKENQLREILFIEKEKELLPKHLKEKQKINEKRNKELEKEIEKKKHIQFLDIKKKNRFWILGLNMVNLILLVVFFSTNWLQYSIEIYRKFQQMENASVFSMILLLYIAAISYILLAYIKSKINKSILVIIIFILVGIVSSISIEEIINHFFIFSPIYVTLLNIGFIFIYISNLLRITINPDLSELDELEKKYKKLEEDLESQIQKEREQIRKEIFKEVAALSDEELNIKLRNSYSTQLVGKKQLLEIPKLAEEKKQLRFLPIYSYAYKISLVGVLIHLLFVIATVYTNFYEFHYISGFISALIFMNLLWIREQIYKTRNQFLKIIIAILAFFSGFLTILPLTFLFIFYYILYRRYKKIKADNEMNGI